MNAPQAAETYKVTYKIRHLSILVWDPISDNGQLQNIGNTHIFLRKSLNLSQPVGWLNP